MIESVVIMIISAWLDWSKHTPLLHQISTSDDSPRTPQHHRVLHPACFNSDSRLDLFPSILTLMRPTEDFSPSVDPFIWTLRLAALFCLFWLLQTSQSLILCAQQDIYWYRWKSREMATWASYCVSFLPTKKKSSIPHFCPHILSLQQLILPPHNTD